MVRLRAGLANDRRWAIADTSGRLITGKRDARVHRIRARYAPDLSWVEVSLSASPSVPLGVPRNVQPETGDSTEPPDPDTTAQPRRESQSAAATPASQADAAAWERFALSANNAALKQWLSEALHRPVELVENPAAGFPDDENFNGPTVISTETLQAITEWFPDLSLDEVRRRFRANLEVAGAEVPFWEDRLYGPVGAVIPFRIGGVRFGGCNPCRRCVVPTRDSRSGRADADFIERFRQMRAATLPPWAERSRFDHHYRLAVNTIVLDAGSTGVIAVGDPVVLEPAVSP
ncbi:MAG: MOSC domain-containing protein [Planctomycetota bacterium]|nr:MAG: MOSC domain-containing protein [Planctomycetota bacterium]